MFEVAKPRPIERNLPRREGRSKRRGTEGRIPGLSPGRPCLEQKVCLEEANEEDTTYYTSTPTALTRKHTGSKYGFLMGCAYKSNEHLWAHLPLSYFTLLLRF